MKTMITMFVYVCCFSRLLLAGLSAERMTHYIEGNKTAPFSGSVYHYVRIIDDVSRQIIIEDRASMSVAVTEPGDTCTWTLRQVSVSHQGTSECLPAKQGTITGVAAPTPFKQLIDCAIELAPVAILIGKLLLR